MGLLPVDRPVALLTRHSVRELSSDGRAGYQLPLTPEGVALAEWWGGQINRPVASFHSSPVGRCVDTALAMARGAGIADVAVVQTSTLVEPGCYVENMREAGPVFLERGPVGFINHYFAQPVPGVLPPADGAGKLLDYVRAAGGAPGTISIHVTHDTILASFIYHLIGKRQITEDDWPWMMEGAWLWFDDNHRAHWIWRGVPGRSG